MEIINEYQKLLEELMENTNRLFAINKEVKKLRQEAEELKEKSKLIQKELEKLITMKEKN